MLLRSSAIDPKDDGERTGSADASMIFVLRKRGKQPLRWDVGGGSSGIRVIRDIRDESSVDLTSETRYRGGGNDVLATSAWRSEVEAARFDAQAAGTVCSLITGTTSTP